MVMVVMVRRRLRALRAFIQVGYRLQDRGLLLFEYLPESLEVLLPFVQHLPQRRLRDVCEKGHLKRREQCPLATVYFLVGRYLRRAFWQAWLRRR